MPHRIAGCGSTFANNECGRVVCENPKDALDAFLSSQSTNEPAKLITLSIRSECTLTG